MKSPGAPAGWFFSALGLDERHKSVSSPTASQFPRGLEDGLSQGKPGRGSAFCWRPEVPQVPRGGSARSSGCRGGSKAKAELLAHVAAVALHHAAPVEAAQAVLSRSTLSRCLRRSTAGRSR